MASNAQTISQFVVFVGAVVTALGILGSYYFGKRTEEARQQETQDNFDRVLMQNEELNKQTHPFLATRPSGTT